MAKSSNILATKSAEIVKEEEFGSIMILAYVLICIVQSIKLWRLCHEKKDDQYSRLKNIGIGERVVLVRTVKKHCPDLSFSDRKKLINALIAKAETLTEEEYSDLLEEVKNMEV